MSRLPIPGQDDNVWGDILNDFLEVSFNNDGTLRSNAIESAGAITSVNGISPSDGSLNITASDINAPTTLSGDTDVVISSPTNNQILTYNALSSKWVNQTPGSGVGLDNNSADIQSLGTKAAGATGLAADAGHVHPMPSLNQINVPTANISLNSQKIVNLANGAASNDAATFGQVPVVGAAGSGVGNALSANDPTTTNGRSPVGNASGDLSGNYPNPTVAKLNGISAPVSAPTTAGQVLITTSSNTTNWETLAGTTDWLNVVTEFGADPTGLNDSTTAILNALIACPTGGVVYLPAGTYTTSAPIIIPPTITLLGSHGTHLDTITTSIQPSASFSGAAVIEMVDQTTGGYATESWEQRVYQLNINGSNLPSSGTVNGIQFTGLVHGVYLQDIYIVGVPGHGITSASNASGTSYSHRGFRLVADATGSYGFNLSMTDCTWIDLEAIGCGGSSHGGFFIGGAANSHFTDCRAEWSGTSGFTIGGSTGTGNGSGGYTFTNCSTDRNTTYGFSITSTGNAPLIFNGCMCRRDGRNGGAGGNSYAGFQVQGATCPVIINGLTVFPGVDDNGAGTNSPQYGVSVSGSTYVALNSGWIHAATTAINSGSNTVFRINPNVGTATGTTAAPTFNYNNPWATDNGSTFTSNLNGNDQTGIAITQSSGFTNVNNAIMHLQTGNNGNDILIKGVVSGDTSSRLVVLASGQLKWGSGSALADTDLYRSGIGALATDGTLKVATSLGVGVSPPTTGISTTVGSAPALSLVTTVGGGSGNTNAIVTVLGTDTQNRAMATSLPGDTNGRYATYVDGTTQWGSGSAVRDTQLQRTSAGILTYSPVNGGITQGTLVLSSSNLTISPIDTQIGLVIQGALSQGGDLQEWQNSLGSVLVKIDNNGNLTTNGTIITANLNANDQTILKLDQASGNSNLNNAMMTYQSGSTGGDYVLKGGVSGDTNSRFGLTSGGKLNWGSGSASYDTDLYRASAGVLQSDSIFTGQGIIASGLTGATAASRYVGATISGAPTSGSFNSGDFIVDRTGTFWICTATGSPGTWTQVATAATGSAGGDLSGSYPNPTVVSTNLSSALPINQGGTGQVTAANAFNALSPMTTAGDMEYESFAGNAASLSGNSTTVPMSLYSTGTGSIATAPTWQRPWQWLPYDHGLISWSFDPATINATAIIPTSGQLNLIKLHIPVAATITNVIFSISTLGSGLTSGDNFAALYNGSGSLLSATADQTNNWQSPGTTGVKIMPLTSAQPVTAGDYYLAFYSVGTTLPTLRTGGNAGSIANANLSLANSRFATANTGLTTAMPGTLAAIAAQAVSWWGAVS